jgi:hypothetical protein
MLRQSVITGTMSSIYQELGFGSVTKYGQRLTLHEMIVTVLTALRYLWRIF